MQYQIAEIDGEYEGDANAAEILSVVEEEIEIDDSRRPSSGETETIDDKIEDAAKQLANLGTVEVHNAATNNVSTYNNDN